MMFEHNNERDGSEPTEHARPASVVTRWLDELPGARLIITSSHVELCARHIEGVPRDDERFVQSERPILVVELVEMVQEMIDWEKRNWKESPHSVEALISDLLDADGEEGDPTP